jgi:REP element-mobilizing transposase RayT
MPRKARIKEEFSTYHVIIRGNERKNIFISDDDRVRFLDTLKRMKDKYNYKLEAYCMMDNHVHLLINDNGNDISKILKSINISYVYYFNSIYKRVGHLFQDRFKSERVDNENYLLNVSAYIHNNPVKAGIVDSPEKYKWSSYNNYIGTKKDDKDDLVEIDRILSQFSNQRKKACMAYRNYVLKFEPVSEILDIEEDKYRYKKENKDYIDSFEVAMKIVE